MAQSLDPRKAIHIKLKQDICNHFDTESDEYENFLHQMELSGLGKGFLKRKKTLHDKFDALEDNGILAVNKYDFLRNIATWSGNDWILELIDDTEEKLRQLDTQTAENGLETLSPEEKRIQNKVISLYEKYCQRVPIYPLRPNRMERVENLYVKPNMIVVDPSGRRAQNDEYRRGRYPKGQENKIKVDKIQDIFYSNGKFCKDVYIEGEMGVGKTSLCEHLVAIWVRSQTGPMPLLQDESFMSTFKFLFYVSLREANRKYKECHHVESMIKSQLQLSDSDVAKLMSDYTCLIVLDGLDELTQKCESENTRFGSPNLPERNHNDKCVYVTTSRPFKLELLAQDLEGKIDQQIAIVGLEQTSQKDLANNVVSLLNSEYHKNKSARQFIRDIRKQNLTEYIETPLLLMLMLGLWYDGKPLGDSHCAIYSNMIEKQIEFTEKVRGLPKEEQLSDMSHDQLPGCFTNQQFCKKYKSVLFQVAKLACERLFDKEQQNTLIFDHEQMEICGLSDDEMKQLLHMGILTQHKVFGGVTEELKSISFLHKSRQEFFCAVHLSTKSQRSELSQLLSVLISGLNDVFELEKIFLFVSGMNAEVATDVFEFIMEKVLSRSRVQEYRRSLRGELSWDLQRMQKIIVAGTDEARKNHQSTAALKLYDIYLDKDEDEEYDASEVEQIIACGSHAKSIYMSQLDVRSWPSSPCLEKIHLHHVDIMSCCDFLHSFAADKLVVVNLEEVGITHKQLDCLCESLSASKNLGGVRFKNLCCNTHNDENECFIQLDFSQHKGLEMLVLADIDTEISSLVLSQEMENLHQVWLHGVTISAVGFRRTFQTLPKNGVTVELGGMSLDIDDDKSFSELSDEDFDNPVRVRGMEMAFKVLGQIRQSPHTEVVMDEVQDNGEECIIVGFHFCNNKRKDDEEMIIMKMI